MKGKKSWTFALVAAASLVWAAAVAAGPKGILVMGMAAEPLTFDPHKTTGFPMGQTWPLVFETLLYRDPSGQIIPRLATAWRVVEPTVWEFKLRPGVKFTNGEPVDAEAVKYSLERIFDPKLKSGQLPLFKTIDRVEAVDALTVRVHTKRPDSFLLSVLADWGGIVPPKYYKSRDLAFLARNPVGSGPYRLARWKKSEEIVFEANSGYWDPSQQRFKTGVHKIIPEPSTRVSALLAGAVDVVDSVPPQLVPMIRANPKFEAAIGPGPKACFVIMMIKDDAPWAKREVRQALNYAVDKEAIVKNVLQGYARVAKGTVVGPASYGHNPDLEPYPYDPVRAKRLLAQAGYPAGFSVEMQVPMGRYMKGTEAAEAVAGQLEKVGVKVRVLTIEYGAWRRRIAGRWEPRAKPFWTYSCRNDLLLHADWMYAGVVHSNSTHGGVRDAGLDKRIDAARAETDEGKRLQMYREINRTVRERALLVFLYHLDQISGKSKRVDWRMRSNEALLLSDAGPVE